MIEQTLTDEVLRAYADTPDPRLRELLGALVRHIHAFAAETALTPAEWQAGIDFLTAVGQTCTAERQEFILLSDVLGLSSAVAGVSAAVGATEPTVLGPFYLAGAPRLATGAHIGRPEDGPAVLIRGHVTDTDGAPLEGATLDVWQSSGNGLYDIQDPGQPAFNLRGVFTTGQEGSFAFRTARPVSYKVPDDGPVGDLLRATGRHNWRAAHLHAIVSAPGYQTVTTHVFDAENPHLDSDAVFGVRDSLIRQFRPAGAGDPADAAFVVDVDFALAPCQP